jgi:hypothetical protein
MDMKAPTWLQLGGGALLFIGSFLDWYGVSGYGFSGTDTDFNGLQGIFTLVIGLGIAGVVALRTFAPQVNVPTDIAGIAVDKMLFMLAVGAFLMCFGGLFISAGSLGPKIGLYFCVVGAALAVAGYVIESRETSSASATSF